MSSFIHNAYSIFSPPVVDFKMFEPARKIVYMQLEAEVLPHYLRSKRGAEYLGTLSESQRKIAVKLVSKPSILKLQGIKSAKSKESPAKQEGALLLEFTKWKTNNPTVIRDEEPKAEVARLMQRYLPELITTVDKVTSNGAFFFFFSLSLPVC